MYFSKDTSQDVRLHRWSVLILSGVAGDTRRYRTLHLIEQFRILGICCTGVHLTDSDLNEKFRQRWDVIVLHRVPIDRYVERLIEIARKKGAVLLFDVDDLIFDLTAFDFIDSPDFVDPLRSRLYKDTMRRIRLTLESCDAVLASTDFLAGIVGRLQKPVWVHRNAFSLEMLKYSEQAAALIKKDPDRIVIGYASGTPTHNRDFALIRPALEQILERYARVDLVMIGPIDSGDWGHYAGRVSHHKLVPWRQLPFVLASFDLNLAPLQTGNPFSQSKSEIKYVEAAMVRVPTVASPTDAFQCAIHQAKTGFLAGSVEEWYSLLAQMIEDDPLRRSMGEAAYSHVIDLYHPSIRAQNLGETIAEISEIWNLAAFPHTSMQDMDIQAAAQSEQEWMPKDLESDPTYWKMGLYSLRHRGLFVFIIQVWVYIRRLVSTILPFSKTKST